MKQFPISLPRRQRELYDLLLGRGDVPIEELHNVLRNSPPVFSVQAMQRWLGPYIANLNRSLEPHGLRVEPGALKQTYRLVVSS